jgi:hypothetical protein
MPFATFPRVIFLSALLLVAGSMFFGSALPARASSLPISGYAWSSNMGYIHFNGSNYGVFEDSSSGTLSGYAWSPYMGWVDFNQADLSNCPSGTCSAQVNTSTGALSGWALAGINSWSWIHLAGTGSDGSTYGVSSANGCWSGFAYGSPDIGYISFSGTAGDGSTYQVGDPTCGATCANGATDYPTCDQCQAGLAYTGPAVGSFSASCVACGGNPAGCTGTGGTAGNPTGSLVCNCGANNPPSCNVYAPIATLSVDHSAIEQGQSAKLTWSSTNATSCYPSGGEGVGFSTGGATSGTVSVSPSVTSTYSITCSGSSGSALATATITVLSPNATISANPTRVSNGDSSTITWDGTDVISCVVSGPSGVLASGNSDSNYNFSINSPQSVAINEQSTFTITCQTGGTPITDSVTVNNLPTFQEF